MSFTRFTTEQLEFLSSARFQPDKIVDLARNPSTGEIERSFESSEVCQAEDRQRASALRQMLVSAPRRKGRSHAAKRPRLPGDPLTVANTLESIGDAGIRTPTPSCLASAVYMRYRRIGVLGAILDLLAEHPRLDAAWVSCDSTSFRFDQNKGWSEVAKLARDHLEHKLSVTGVYHAHGLLIGFFRGYYAPHLDQFQLRYGGMVAGAKVSCIQKVHARKTTSKSEGKDVYIRLHPLRDMRQRISGLLPNFLPQLAPSSKGFSRMQEPAHTLYLLWLAQHRLADLSAIHGVFYWDGRLKIAECQQPSKGHRVRGTASHTAADVQVYRSPTPPSSNLTITQALPGM